MPSFRDTSGRHWCLQPLIAFQQRPEGGRLPERSAPSDSICVLSLCWKRVMPLKLLKYWPHMGRRRQTTSGRSASASFQPLNCSTFSNNSGRAIRSFPPIRSTENILLDPSRLQRRAYMPPSKACTPGQYWEYAGNKYMSRGGVTERSHANTSMPFHL